MQPAEEKPGFTLRAAVIAVCVSLFLLASSTYIALKFGLLPWPIIFSVIVAGGLLKLVNRGRPVSVHEINCAQAGSSIGGLVAGGLAFTLPGMIYLNQTRGLEITWPNPWLLALLTAAAGLLGVLFSVPLKFRFVDEEQLPYPAGTAGAELLRAGKTGGRQLSMIIAVAAAAGIFALVRDTYFPGGLSFPALASYGILLSLLPMPVLIAGGYILGPRAGFSWFGGAFLGWLVLSPLLVLTGVVTAPPVALLQNVGMGMVLGSGVGFFILYIAPRLRAIFEPLWKSAGAGAWWLWLLSALSVVALFLLDVPVGAALLTLAGLWLMVAIAARMTGETNIDPLEQFGIFVGLLVTGIYAWFGQDLSLLASFMIVTFVSVGCAIAGDAGHDYKSASILGTRFSDIVKIDLIAVAVAGLAAPLVLALVRFGFAEKLFTPEMPAPQAKLVAGSIFGFEHPGAFYGGFALAFCLELLNRLLPKAYRDQLLLMPMGIGLFLGPGLAIPLALGAAIRWYLDRTRAHLYQAGVLLAAGIMGGEGFAGFSAGALTALGFSHKTGALSLAAMFALVLVASLVGWGRPGTLAASEHD